MSLPTVLITGAAKRIGRAMALDLSKAGFAIALHCHQSRDEAEALCQLICVSGGRACVVQADLAQSATLHTLIEQVNDQLGAVQLLINNASLFETDSLSTLDLALYQRQMAVNLTAPVLLAQAMAAQSPPIQQGLLVNIIDQRVLKLTPQHFSYTLSKAALWAATRTLAQSMAPHWRVNAIAPGPTLPSLRQSPALFEQQSRATLLQRGAHLSEFAATIDYLWRTPSITGQMIALDGGQHLSWQTPDALAEE